jgi:hypothetical protein
LKQVGAILKSQEGTPAASRPSFERTVPGFSAQATPPESTANTPVGEESQATLSRNISVTSSGLQSPSERRHIHFNDEVVQCIAVESKDDDEEEGQPPTVVSDEEDEDDDDDDDDDGLVMMKDVPSKARTSNRSTPRSSFSIESKTIAPLPSTTLKYRSDTPEPPESQQQQPPNLFWPAGKTLSPSPSQETLRPARPNVNFLIDDDEEYPDLQWQPSASLYKGPSQEASLSYQSEDISGDGYDPGPGMRRTPSGMFMPYDDDEDEAALEKTLFGRVVDTVNTARDIAHVIWNVGWRR